MAKHNEIHGEKKYSCDVVNIQTYVHCRMAPHSVDQQHFMSSSELLMNEDDDDDDDDIHTFIHRLTTPMDGSLQYILQNTKVYKIKFVYIRLDVGLSLRGLQ